MTRPRTQETSTFDAETAIVARGASSYATTLTDRWNALAGGPNGGYCLALCVRALTDTLPQPDPLVVSAFFLRAAAPGDAEIRTELVRSGRRFATGQAGLYQRGREIVRAVATYGDLEAAAGRTFTASDPPRLPDPETAVDLVGDTALPGVSIVERFDYRFAELPGWRTGAPSGDPSHAFWLRFKDGRPADLASLPLLVDAAAPAVLELGEIASLTLELTVHLRAKPAPGWLACRVATRHVRDGIHEEDFEIWDSRDVLVAQARQLAVLPAGAGEAHTG